MKVITEIWLAFMLILSHIGGTASGAESRWLSSMTGVKESVLRRSAHVVVYIILSTLVMEGWGEVELWIRIVVLVLIAVVDESSKALPVFKGRHCSVAEIGLNLIGVAIGVVIGMMI